MALKNMFGDVATEDTLSLLSITLTRLSEILNRFSTDNTGRLRVTAEVVATTNIGSVAGPIGGLQASYDQIGQMMIGAEYIRSRIVVS